MLTAGKPMTDSNQSRYLTRDIVDNNGSLCSAVVHRCKTVIALLSGCVPNLKLDRVVVDTDSLGKERSCSPEHNRQILVRKRSNSRNAA